MRLRTFAIAALGSLFLVACIWAYLPGLNGGFLFDDYVNLPALGSGGPITHWATFWRFVTSGHADPTGRPIALLSFLVDARDWPAPAYPFKRTNLILHLFNGLLVAGLLAELGRAALAQGSQSMRWRLQLAAVLAAGLWLIHPLFVSTTLYIVQREAMLSTMFVLLGLILWLRGRAAWKERKAAAGIAWMTAGLVICTALATLSKANGLLLPALALLLETVWPWRTTAQSGHTAPQELLARSEPPPRGYRVAVALLAGVPSLALFAYLAWSGASGLIHGIGDLRPWTLGQRLLTEPRVMLDYLRLLWVPHPYTAGLFNDQFALSTSLWSPPGTLPAILAVLALIAGAAAMRRRWPAASAALLFFFLGQSIESGPIPLELYFEHRNYLPAALMFWPLALWLCGVSMRLSMHSRGGPSAAAIPFYRHRVFRLLTATAAALTLVTMTHARAALWGNEQEQAILWATLNPHSPRAQASAAMAETSAGHPAEAADRLAPLLARQPDQVQLALNLLSARCALGHLDATTLTAAQRALRSTRDTGTLLASWFGRAIEQSKHPVCPELTLDAISALLSAALDNPLLASEPGRRQDLYSLQGRIALARGQGEQALVEFNRALDQQVRATAAFQQAAMLGTAGYPELGLSHLDHYEIEASSEAPPGPGMPRVHAWVLARQHYWERELVHLRNTLQTDAEAKQRH